MKRIHLGYCHKLIFTTMVILCSIADLYAQIGQTVSGIVKDNSGDPLIT